MRSIKKVKRIVSLFTVILILSGLLPILNVSAAIVHTIPDTSLNTIINAVNINMGNDNLTSYQWKNVQGKVTRDDYGNYIFSVPIKSTTSEFSYNNVMELKFSDVMSIGGRKVNATVSIDSISVSKPYWVSGEEEGYLSFMMIYSNSIWFGTDSVINLYRAEKTTKVTTTFTYADTGEKIDVPLYQILNDIDICDRAGYEEMWQGNSGYAGDIYTFESCKLKIDQDNMKLEATAPTSGDASYLDAGAIVSINSSVVTQTYSAANASTGMILYSPYDDRNMTKPSKNVEEKMYQNGENVTWNINQKVHTWQADIFSYYTNFTIEDILPEEVEYVNSKVLHNGVDVTDKGTLSYDSVMRKLKFEFKAASLNDTSLYDGGIYMLEINTKAVNKTDKVLTATNTATTNINEVKQNTGNTEVQINYDRVSVSAEKQWNDFDDISGIRPNSIDVVLNADGTKIGNYTITKNQDWKITVTNLPKYSEGKEVKYTWDEISVDGYTSDISTTGNSTIITNTHTPVYMIETEIDHGVITENQTNVPYGSSRTISWKAGEGRYIDSVTVDGKEIPDTTTSYTFTNITADHKVVVKTLPYHKIMTEIDNGTITDEIKEIKNGESKTVSWVPGTGRYVTKVIVNGSEFYVGNKISGYPTSYEFSDITEYQEIKVETKLIPNLTITKESDKDTYNVNDDITYTIIAKQTVKNAVATNVVITDKDKTKGLVFNLETVTCSDETAIIKTQNDTFAVSLNELAHGKTVTITVKGKVIKDELESSDIKNIATIKSDQTEEVSADKNVEINYNIITAVENGTIDESVFSIKNGETKTITFKPNDGYYLKEIKVDGNILDISEDMDSYTFDSIKNNHLIEVKYAPYYKVITKIDYGTITEDKADIKKGENHTVIWAPGDGRYVTKVTVNGTVSYNQDNITDYPISYEFTNIESDCEIIVETAPIPEETTVQETTIVEKVIPEETSIAETTTQEEITKIIKKKQDNNKPTSNILDKRTGTSPKTGELDEKRQILFSGGVVIAFIIIVGILLPILLGAVEMWGFYLKQIWRKWREKGEKQNE